MAVKGSHPIVRFKGYNLQEGGKKIVLFKNFIERSGIIGEEK